MAAAPSTPLIRTLVFDGVFAETETGGLRFHPASPPRDESEWADDTSHLLFEPLELLEKLAALPPGPHINLALYHGVLAPLGLPTEVPHARPPRPPPTGPADLFSDLPA